MQVLVTGASGFIGRHLAAELERAGHHVSTLHRGGPISGISGVHVAADILSSQAREAAGRAEAIVHLAGRGDVQASFEHPFEYSKLNALGTLNILEGARAAGAHVVFASTQRVYAVTTAPVTEDAPLEPTDPYAVAKLVSERWARMYSDQLGLPTTTLRLFTVYGPGQVGRGVSGVVEIFLSRARLGLPIEVHGIQQRDLTWVGDVACGLRLAVEQPSQPGQHRVYNLASGVGTSLEKLAELVCSAVGSSSTIVRPTAPSPEGNRIADISRARSELGYQPRVGIEEGLRTLAGGA